MAHPESEDELSGSEMSFGDHLEELRSRLIKAILGTILAFLIVFTFRDPVMAFVTRPYSSVALEMHMSPSLYNVKPAGAFMSYLTVSGIVALLVSAPYWMWQFWAFIAAGLYAHEKKVVYKFAPPMFLLFGGGVAFGYGVLIPICMSYLLSFSDPTVVQNWIDLSEYLTLFTTLTLVLGLTFQLPILMGLVSRLGVLPSSTFRRFRRHFILVAFIVAAILTPPDAISQVLMALPLTLLFELGIVIAWFSEGKRLRDIDLKPWRLQMALAALLLVGVGLSFGQLRKAYRSRLVGQRVARETDEVGAEQFPYMKVFARTDWIGFKPKAAFRISEESDDRTGRSAFELWAVGAGEKSLLVEISFRSDTIAETSQTAEESLFLVTTGSQTVKVHRVRERAGAEFMNKLILALETAGEDDRIPIESLIAGLVGQRPEGARPIEDGGSESEADATVEAWSEWWRRSGREWVWKAP